MLVQPAASVLWHMIWPVHVQSSLQQKQGVSSWAGFANMYTVQAETWLAGRW